MRQEPVPVRGLLLTLSTGLILGSAGCISGEQRAQRPWNRLAEGMSMDDVADLAGPAERRIGSEGLEVWHYSYSTVPDGRKIGAAAGHVLLLATCVGILLLLAAAASQSGSSLPEMGGPPVLALEGSDGGSGKAHFRVVFDRTGRVMSVSSVEPCGD
ncbi:MAG TPA: hypothetical protein VE981_15525 [Planctomycetota bacterium]|nr:hypothetical protein [Planctomycetota bacterium]